MSAKSKLRLSENRIVDMLRRRFTVRSPLLERGIGDDAAVIRPPGAKERWVVTTDMLLEDVDFRRAWQTPAQLGWKSLVVNLSDLAAMGARPRFYTVSLALPGDIGQGWIASFYRGLQSAGAVHGAALIGGDLSSSPQGIQISITAVGETLRRRVVYRSGGQAGDCIYVTGILGLSAAGLLLLQRGRTRGRTAAERLALKAHRMPAPRCAEGEWLAQNRFSRAMMDLSDGLSMDLPRLCRASGCGAAIYTSRLPRFEQAGAWGCNPLELALHGGEDFELLFCLPSSRTVELEADWPSRFPPIRCIGRLNRRPGMVWMEAPGSPSQRLPERGYDHFRGK